MARTKNDGKGRLGGRRKGTPNKVTGNLKAFLADLIDDQREQIVTDLAGLEPKDRLLMIERFMQYVIPKAERQQQEETQLPGSININVLSKKPEQSETLATVPAAEVDFAEVQKYWNDHTKGVFPAIVAITPEMKEEIKARVAETSMESFYTMIDKTVASDFLRGKDGKWRASFNWCIQKERFASIINGKYDNSEVHDSSEGYKDYFDTEIKINDQRSTESRPAYQETHDSSAGEKDYFNGDFGI